MITCDFNTFFDVVMTQAFFVLLKPKRNLRYQNYEINSLNFKIRPCEINIQDSKFFRYKT